MMDLFGQNEAGEELFTFVLRLQIHQLHKDSTHIFKPPQGSEGYSISTAWN